uniref:Uncharacterized protein n=1 Tax=Romanomermis culicivorax TaxID=13658 RepID=A0A915HGP0_ROMCU
MIDAAGPQPNVYSKLRKARLSRFCPDLALDVDSVSQHWPSRPVQSLSSISRHYPTKVPLERKETYLDKHDEKQERRKSKIAQADVGRLPEFEGDPELRIFNCTQFIFVAAGFLTANVQFKPRRLSSRCFQTTTTSDQRSTDRVKFG